MVKGFNKPLCIGGNSPNCNLFIMTFYLNWQQFQVIYLKIKKKCLCILFVFKYIMVLPPIAYLKVPLLAELYFVTPVHVLLVLLK